MVLASIETVLMGWGHNSVVEHLPSMYKALGSLLSTEWAGEVRWEGGCGKSTLKYSADECAYENTCRKHN
jgi:hypothetical protein